MKTKIYEVEGPDGKIYEIEGPANATDAEVTTAAYEYYTANRPVQKPQEKAGALRRVGDIGLSAVQGAIGIPEAVVGLADIPTGGRVGKALEGVGFKPKEAKQILQEYKSPEQQAAEQYVGEGEGFFDTVGRAVERPSAIASTIAQSVPSMLGGAGIARGVLSAAPKLGALTAGAIGEGAVGAGLSAEDIRQQTDTGLLTGQQAGLSTLSGVFTGLLGGFGGKVAQKYLKVGDIDTILAGGVSPAQKSGLLTSMFKAGLSEAALEELPQSGQEQVMRNLALNKPWDEGVAESMAMGVLAALPMGAGAGYSSYRAGERKTEAEEQQRQAALAASSAERARQSALVAEAKQTAEQAQYAGEERAADIAGQANVEAQIAADTNVPRTKQAELDLYPETTVEEIAARRAAETDQGDLFIPESTIQEITKPKLDESTITSFGFKKNSLAYKALEALNDPEMSPKAKVERFEKIIENNQDKIKSTAQGEAVDKFRSLLTRRIPADPAALEKIKLEKAQQAEIAELRRRSQAIKAREKELAIFDNDPMKKAAFEKGPAAWQAYQAQEQAKPQIPDEAYPVFDAAPEVSYDEKMAQLERARSEQEAQDFQLEEQYAMPPTKAKEELVNEPSQQVPAGQGKLFTQFGKPTAAAMRGTPDTSGVDQTQSKRIDQRDVVPSETGAPAPTKTEAAVTGPLGDVGGTTGRPKVRAETSEEAQPSPLKNSVFSGTMAADYLLTGGFDVMVSAEYLLQAYAGLSQKSSQAVENIRKKYTKLINDSGLRDVKDFVKSDLYTQIISEIEAAISKAHNGNPLVSEIIADIGKYPTGMPPKVGDKISAKLEQLEAETEASAQTKKNQPSALTYKEDAKPIRTIKEAVDAIREVEAYWAAQDAKAPVDLDDNFVADFESFKQSLPTNPKEYGNWVKEARTKVQKMKSMVDAAVQENAAPDEDMVSYDDLVNEPYDENDQYFESRKAKPINEEARIQQLLKTSNELSYPDVKKILSQYDLSDFTYANYKTLELAVDSATANWINNGKNSGFDTENEAIGMYLDGAINDIQKENRRNSTLESRKAKPKAKTGAKPKDVSGKLREESTEPTTPELFAEKVSQWFNPVWYKNAVKNGMVNIVDGDINDSDLSDAIKEKYSTAKALFTPDGKAYFFIKNITKGNELGVFLHEIGEHKGLDNLIGKDRVKQLANRVRQMAEGKGSAKEVAMAKQAIEMAEGQSQNDKEVIAYFGEIAVFNGVRPGAKAKPEFGKATGWITELWNSITNAIKKLNLNPEKITDKDVVDMLYGAARLEMGAVQSFEEQVGEPVPNEPDILASLARNPALELSPEEAAARRARGLTVRPPPQRQTMKEKMQDNMGMSKGRDEFFNRMGNAIVGPLFTIHRKATAYYGPEGFYTKSTGRLLGSLMGQHSLNSNNYSFEAIKRGGLEIEKQGFIKSIDSDANIVNLNKDYDALMKALQADGTSEATAYQQIANMILADRYKSLKMIGAKSTDEFSKEDAAEGYALREKHKSLYDQWRNRYNAMRKNKVDFLVQSGAYTRKEADTLMNRLEYVPLYRIKDSEGADGIFMQGLLSSKQQQKLQFDTKNYDVADIMTNIALNEMWLYKKAIFNHTTNLLIDQVEEMGGGKHVKVKNPNDEQTIAYLRDGELKFFKFDDPNDMAMLRAVPVINNWAVNQMRFLGGILRKGITLTPSFIYRQVWQDVERGWMQSGTNQPFHKMLGQSIREQAKNAKRDSETRLARELRSRGVIGAVEYQDSFENAIDELFGREPANQSIFEKAYKKLEYMEKLAQNSDMAARAIVYENALNEINPATGEKYSQGEAALRAQMMLNYQHRGTSPAIRALLSTIPFINTKLQSEWRLVEALQGKIPGLPKAKAKQLLAMKILKMATLSAAYAMMRAGDDDYEEASDEQRNRNFLINAGGIPLRIPVAPEYMLIKAGMEQLTRKAIDAEFYTDRKLGHAVASSIGGLLLGVDDVTPSVLRPLLENMTNYSFFNDRALVGQGLQGRDVNLQYVEGQTSELAKFISNSLQAVGGNVVNVSPIKIDNFINGVFGTMGRDVLFTTNLIAEGISGNERPELKLSQYPEIGTAFYNPEGSQRVADYYQVRDKVMTAYSSYRSLIKTDPERAREYLEENRKLIALRGPVDAIGNRLEQLRARQNRILADDKLSEEQKRAEMDKITEQKNQVVTGPTKMLRKRMEE